MIIATCIIIGVFSGAALVFAAQEGILRDLVGAAFLAVLVAIAMALSLCLIGCAGTGEYYDIPVDFAPYGSDVTPLSQAGCDGR